MIWQGHWNEVISLFEYAYWVADKFGFIWIMQAVFLARLAFFFLSRLFSN